MKRARTPITTLVAAMAPFFALAAVVPAAQAARFPKQREAKALRKAFKNDPNRPKRASITVLQVSTVDKHWARVGFAVPPRAAGRALAKASGPEKIIYYKLPSADKAKPAKKAPPKKVKKDLTTHFYVDLKYTMTGEEDGQKTTVNPPPQTEKCTETIADDMKQTFSWTQTHRIDLDHASTTNFDPVTDKVTSEIYPDSQQHPFRGTIEQRSTETGTYSGDANCPPRYTIVCTDTYRVQRSPYNESLYVDDSLVGFFSAGADLVSAHCTNHSGRLGERFIGGPLVMLPHGLCCGADAGNAL